MLKTVLGAMAAGATALAATSAFAANGFYVSGSIGAADRQPFGSVASEPTDPFGNSIFENGVRVPYNLAVRQRFNTGVDLNLAGGYRFGLGGHGDIRTELEFGYISGRLANVTDRSLPSPVFAEDQHIGFKTLSGLGGQRFSSAANVFYDFVGHHGFTPYVGAGLGYEHSVLSSGMQQYTGTLVDAAGTFHHVRAVFHPGQQDDNGVYLAEAGVSVALSKRLAIVPAYRFTDRFDGLAVTHILKIGLRYNF